MKIMLKHFIAIALLLLISVVALCREKRSPLIFEDSERVSDVNRAFYKTKKIVEQGWMTENREKTGKQDNWDIEYDPIRFDVFVFACSAIAATLLIICGIMTYNLIRDNPFSNLRYEKKN